MQEVPLKNLEVMTVDKSGNIALLNPSVDRMASTVILASNPQIYLTWNMEYTVYIYTRVVREP